MARRAYKSFLGRHRHKSFILAFIVKSSLLVLGNGLLLLLLVLGRRLVQLHLSLVIEQALIAGWAVHLDVSIDSLAGADTELRLISQYGEVPVREGGLHRLEGGRRAPICRVLWIWVFEL
jgi:hypothetical protein